MTTAHATEVAGLKQKLDVADDDIMLINRRLDKARGLKPTTEKLLDYKKTTA